VNEFLSIHCLRINRTPPSPLTRLSASAAFPAVDDTILKLSEIELRGGSVHFHLIEPAFFVFVVALSLIIDSR
jgi:hypothetical protein